MEYESRFKPISFTPDDGGVQIWDVMSLGKVKIPIKCTSRCRPLQSILVNFVSFLQSCFTGIKICIAFQKNSRTTKPFVKQRMECKPLKGDKVHSTKSIVVTCLF